MRVTQQDIARLAEVSQATVSRVLSGDQKVETSIRDRVLGVMSLHNYQPDVRARSLRSQRTQLIGLVVQRPEGGLANDPFFAGLIGEIIEHLSGKPYHLCLDMVSDSARRVTIYDELLRTRRVDGLILVESEARDERILRLQQDQFPFVLIGNPLTSDEIHSIDNDNVEAGRVATQHLIENGFKRIAFLGARPGITVSDDRISGYRQALAETNLTETTIHADFGAEAAREGIEAYLRRGGRPDAIVVLDDYMAMGVVQAARARGLQIPSDLGLVSFNDTNLCSLLDCGLTSVSLNMKKVVQRACDRLLKIIEEKPITSATRVIIPTELKVRGSSIKLGVMVR